MCQCMIERWASMRALHTVRMGEGQTLLCGTDAVTGVSRDASYACWLRCES